MPTLLESMAAIQAAIGPQRVKTKELEVEQYSMKELLLMAAHTRARPVQLAQFGMTIVSPSCSFDTDTCSTPTCGDC